MGVCGPTTTAASSGAGRPRLGQRGTSGRPPSDRPGRHRPERARRAVDQLEAPRVTARPRPAAGSAPRRPQRRASSASIACPIAASRSAACGVTSRTPPRAAPAGGRPARAPARCCSMARERWRRTPGRTAAPRADDDDLVHLEARHGDALDHREAAQVDHRHLAPIARPPAVGVAPTRAYGPTKARPRVKRRTPARRSTRPSASSSVSEPFVDSHTYQRPSRHRGCAGGTGRPARRGRRRVAGRSRAVLAVDLPPLVALEAAEGAHVQRAVDDHQRVHVPGPSGTVEPCHTSVGSSAPGSMRHTASSQLELTWGAPSNQRTSWGSRMAS